MKRGIRALLGIFLILVITFSAVTIFQNIGSPIKIDVTEQGLYTLSDGTRSILDKLNQPITLKLYYAKTAAMKGRDQIKFFDNYYEYVKSLLDEYVDNSGGMVRLEIIDPRPYSDEEVEALRFGLRRFPITEEETFFFGLVAQTQFGAEKAIPFFSPDRQNFVEYDISELIDSIITREKSRIGVISSLPVMGDDMSDYMVQMMRMQGQQPQPAWGIIDHLREKFEVVTVNTESEKIENVDILMVIHPKDLSEKTLFAIDQFVLSGGRTMVFLDPFCLVENPRPNQMQMQAPPEQSSGLPELLEAWGLEMPSNTFAGDVTLALQASIRQGQRPERILGFLGLSEDAGCYNEDSIITAALNDVRLLYPGALRPLAGQQPEGVQYRPLIRTSQRGNTWKVGSTRELSMTDPAMFLERFIPGDEPVVMGYQIIGPLKSAFPEGIEIKVEPEENMDEEGGEDAEKPEKRRINGLTESTQDSVVLVFSDVDFISDIVAYQNSIFGKMVVGDNAALVLNAVDELGGSQELISIRSRGNYRREFSVVKAIEEQAEAETREEEEKLNAEIKGFEQQLNQILSQAQEGEEEIIGSSILKEKQELQSKIRQAQIDLRNVKMQRRERIEKLQNRLRNWNMLAAPAAILIIAIFLAAQRSMRRRYYVSHRTGEG